MPCERRLSLRRCDGGLKGGETGFGEGDSLSTVWDDRSSLRPGGASESLNDASRAMDCRVADNCMRGDRVAVAVVVVGVMVIVVAVSLVTVIVVVVFGTVNAFVVVVAVVASAIVCWWRARASHDSDSVADSTSNDGRMSRSRTGAATVPHANRIHSLHAGRCFE